MKQHTMQKFIAFLCATLGLSITLTAQTLPPGAVAFVAFQSDQPISFAFVNLIDLQPGTQISFTDNKWGFDHLVTSEQTVVWTSPDTVLPIGTIVKLRDNGGDNMQVLGAGSTLGKLYLMGGQGDQILAYTGPESDPSFIAGISNSNWQPTCDSLTFFQFRTCLPEPLENGVTAISFTNSQGFNIDNGYFGITPFQATGMDMLTIINNVNYWFFDNGPGGGFDNWPNWEQGSTQPFASTIEFTQPSFTISEGGNQAVFTLQLSAPQFTPQTVVIDILEFPGITSTDFSTTPAVANGSISLDIPANTTEITFSVQALIDGFGETDENITFTISALSGGLVAGDQDNAQLTILNTDQNFSQINFANDSLFITEGTNAITLNMSITPPAPATYVVIVSAFNGAGIQTDYFTVPALANNQLLLQSSPNASTITFNLNTFNDFVIEADEIVRFTITTVSSGLQIGNQSSCILVIRDNDNEPVVYIPEVFVNEICSVNPSYPDENGQLDDWFELYNADTATVVLSGYSVTNSLSTPTLFTIPPISNQTTMLPGSFKVFWADQNTTQGALHTNFTLSESAGGLVALFAPDGETLIDALNFPNMLPGQTFGRFEDGESHIKLMFVATPGAPNTDSIPDVGLKPALETFDGLFSVFPNPVSDRLQIVKAGNGNEMLRKIEAFDVSGRSIELKTETLIPNKSWSVSTDGLPAGIYNLVLSSEVSISTLRFLVQNP